MISAQNVTLKFGKEPLFKDVNISFTPGNCYGLIGANGAGKSTFLKILSGEIEPSEGAIVKPPKARLAVLRQDQFAFDALTVLDAVIVGHKALYDVMVERNALYSKEELTDEDGEKVAELEELFGEMNGYESETEAAQLLSGLGVDESLHGKQMKELEAGIKVRVLLAQALFGNPDILLLDEPTNYLDIETISWLEHFLDRFENTVIVVSHDRHFLDSVCTHIADIDFGKIELYSGNYTFWYEASQLALKQKKDENKRKEDKRKELQDFIARFSSNASKARQATARKKMLDKLTVEDIKPSSRRFPYVMFKPGRECGRTILEIEDLCVKTPEASIQNFSMLVRGGDKIAFLGDHHARSLFFDMIMGEAKHDSGTIKWGETITTSYFPKENRAFFDNDFNLIDWLRQFSEEKDENFIRGFFGRMLFAGDEVFKKVKVLSGGEKVRCMLSKMMLANGNVLVLDEPTNHLDLESITAVNDALIAFPEVVLFSSHDHTFIQTIANRIIEFTPHGIIDRAMTFDEYMENEEVKRIRDEAYGSHERFML